MAIALLLTMALAIACGSPSPSTAPTASETFRTVDHAMGSALVPNEPRRVVVMGTAPLDVAIALGVTPVGAWVNHDFPGYLGNRTDGIEIISTGGPPNIEAIAKLQPDLILGSKIGSEAIYPSLVQIAPTVLSEENGREGDWEKQLRLYGEALGKSGAAEQRIKDYQTQLKALQQKLEAPEDTVVSLVFSFRDYIGFYSHTSFSGSILSDIGFARPKIQTQPTLSTYLSIVSKEAFQDLDGDIIFLIVNEHKGSNSLTHDAFVQDPLFSQLSAVKNKQVYPVKSEVWTAGRNVLAAQQVLKDIGNALAN